MSNTVPDVDKGVPITEWLRNMAKMVEEDADDWEGLFGDKAYLERQRKNCRKLRAAANEIERLRAIAIDEWKSTLVRYCAFYY